MSKITFTPQGVCCKKIEFDYDNGKISNVQFSGGCNGNLKAISILVNNMDSEELIAKLKGNTCGMRNTSCVDQLAEAVLLEVKKGK